jgi:hypothetical protein
MTSGEIEKMFAFSYKAFHTHRAPSPLRASNAIKNVPMLYTRIDAFLNFCRLRDPVCNRSYIGMLRKENPYYRLLVIASKLIYVITIMFNRNDS